MAENVKIVIYIKKKRWYKNWHCSQYSITIASNDAEQDHIITNETEKSLTRSFYLTTVTMSSNGS